MIGLTLTGADGSFWDLRSGAQGVLMVSAAAEGFGAPKYTRPVRSTPTRSGQRRTGAKSTAAAREGFLPIETLPQHSEAAFYALRDAWWRAWDPDVASTLTATRADGTKRSIACFWSEEDYAPDADPSELLADDLSLSWVADEPFWKGSLVSSQVGLGGASASDFLNGGAAPPFVLAPSNAAGSGVLANPGDEAAWPVLRVGPGSTSFGVTLGGASVSGAFTVPTGGSLTVDYGQKVALLRDGAGNVSNVTPQLSARAFRPVAKGGSVPVTTSLTGALGASLSLEFAPLYRRAW